MLKRRQFITIPSFARTELDLSGNELITFGLIYGFCQDGRSEYSGGLQYIADWCGLSSRIRAKEVVQRLIDKGVVEGKEIIVNNVKFVNYKVSDTVYLKEIQGVSEKDTNNIEDNINTPSISNDISPKGEDVDAGFDEFWEKYDKKVQRAQAERMWRKLNNSQKQEVLDSVEAYVASTPDKQYRLNPASYLNPKNKRWQDELRTNSTSLIDSSKSFVERRDEFYYKVNALFPKYEKTYGSKGAHDLLRSFYLTWSSQSKDGLYMKWELQKIFDFDKELELFEINNGWKFKH